MIYIFLRYKNKSALKLVLDFEYPSKFWGFRITYRLPVGLPLLRKRPIKNIVQIDYPRVSPGAHPLAKKHEDSGYEIVPEQICQSSRSEALAKRIAALGTRMGHKKHRRVALKMFKMLPAFGQPVQHMSQHHATTLQNVVLKCCVQHQRFGRVLDVINRTLQSQS